MAEKTKKYNNTATALASQMEQEVTQYLTEVVNVGEGHDFSQYKLVKRISLFENKIYPTGKFDSQGNYKYWFDLITPRIDSEVKNIDFDTKDILVYSDRKNDDLACLICNLKIKEYLRETGQAEEINSTIEEGSGWGNVLWKRIKGSYERADLRNTYIVNQTARTVNQTPIIERHQLTASDVREKADIYVNIKEVLEQCSSDTYKSEVGTTEKATTVPYYDFYERNGEVCVKDLKAWKDEPVLAGDEDKYVQAKVIGAGTKGSNSGVSIQYIVFAEAMPNKKNSDIYKEFHRGRYKGRWWREGLYELLMDLQVRGNAIGNQIAQGLELASKNIYSTEDKLIVQNVMSDLKNGDIIKAKSLQHVEVRMNGFDQLLNDWNRIVALANDIANSREIVNGETSPNQPFRLGALLNANANKLFDFIREKLSIPLSEIFEEWIIPDLVRDLKSREILNLTGDPDMLMRMQVAIVDDWYLSNLAGIPPHTPDQAKMLKMSKLQELVTRPQLLIEGFAKFFENFKPHAKVVISGENSTLDIDLQTLGSFAQLEPDPVRRSGILDLMMKRKGIDVASLPKSQPPPPPPATPAGPPQAAAPVAAA